MRFVISEIADYFKKFHVYFLTAFLIFLFFYIVGWFIPDTRKYDLLAYFYNGFIYNESGGIFKLLFMNLRPAALMMIAGFTVILTPLFLLFNSGTGGAVHSLFSSAFHFTDLLKAVYPWSIFQSLGLIVSAGIGLTVTARILGKNRDLKRGEIITPGIYTFVLIVIPLMLISAVIERGYGHAAVRNMTPENTEMINLDKISARLIQTGRTVEEGSILFPGAVPDEIIKPAWLGEIPFPARLKVSGNLGEKAEILFSTNEAFLNVDCDYLLARDDYYIAVFSDYTNIDISSLAVVLTGD